jgi:signal transduction histidine kinase
MTNANAGLRWIGQTPPNVAETQQALERILYETRRTDDVVGSIRAMFKSEGASRISVDLNELINEVLTLTKADLEKGAIIVRTELDKNLAPVIGNRVQLRQVLFNLVTNAIKVMNSVAIQDRQLLIKSQPGTSGEVNVTVEDSGSGIDQKHIERICRHGNRSIDLPIDHRIALRSSFCFARQSPWRNLSIHIAGC